LNIKSVKAWLRRSEGYDEYREMLQISPDAVLINSNERFVYANSAALRMFAAPSLETLVRRRGFEVVHPDFRDAAAAIRRRDREYGL
jgi:PAS domain-containing protein